VYVVRRRVLLDEAGVLEEGDAARVTGGRALSVRPADGPSGAEVLVWEMHGEPARPGWPSARPPERPRR
jgi:hypothetical protein